MEDGSGFDILAFENSHQEIGMSNDPGICISTMTIRIPMYRVEVPDKKG